MTGRYRDGYRALHGSDPARLIAFDVLQEVHVGGAYANLVLPRALRAARRDIPTFDARDAAFTSELVYGTLRQRGRLDWELARHMSRDIAGTDPAVMDLLRLGAHQILDMRVPDHAAVAATVDLARQVVTDGPVRMVNAVLRRVAEDGAQGVESAVEGIADTDQRLAVGYSHPVWMVRAFRSALVAHGYDEDELGDLLGADNVPPEVTLVARPGLVAPWDLADEAQDILSTRVAPGDVSEFAVVLEDGDPASLPSVRSGSAGVQDEGSQLAALVAAAAPVEGQDTAWLDLCAGPGGKAAVLGALAAGRGAHLVANEVHPHRSRLVERSVRALPEGTVEVHTGDGRTFGGAGSPWELGSFDRLLLDAPCTGMGSLRRRPESRWRRAASDLEDLVVLQAQLLDRALALVRPGGVLTYVTCSPHVRETRDQVERVLDRGGVALEDTVAVAQSLAPRSLDVPAQAGRVTGMDGTTRPGRTLQLWQHRQGTDLMFVACLRRLG